MVLYTIVFARAFERTPISLGLVALSLALVVSGFWRNYFQYERPNVNVWTMHLDLLLAFLFSLVSQYESFKFFLVFALEGIAVLPKPYCFAFTALALAVGAGSTALFELRESGLVQPPAIAEILLYAFLILLIFSERRQREQRMAFEKLSEELSYVNLQLKESMAWSESLASQTERRRIAGEIHDSLGHHLTGLILSLEAGKRLMSRDRDAAGPYWDKALQVARDAMQSVRELVSVKSKTNPEFELVSRLTEMAQGVYGLTGLKIILDFAPEEMDLSGQEQFQIYRMFQEAVTNTLRHAHADQAGISISRDRDSCYFSYWDNGWGTDQIEKGNGLNGMLDRVAAIGGTICFESQAGRGFRIEASIPRKGEGNG